MAMMNLTDVDDFDDLQSEDMDPTDYGFFDDDVDYDYPYPDLDDELDGYEDPHAGDDYFDLFYGDGDL